jgi:hypothetical protein
LICLFYSESFATTVTPFSWALLASHSEAEFESQPAHFMLYFRLPSVPADQGWNITLKKRQGRVIIIIIIVTIHTLVSVFR